MSQGNDKDNLHIALVWYRTCTRSPAMLLRVMVMCSTGVWSDMERQTRQKEGGNYQKMTYM